jgi:hypothetical protein
MAFGHGLKVLDAGASVLWDHPTKLVARESAVMLETFERLFQMPKLLKLIDNLSSDPSLRLTALDALARLQASLSILSEAYKVWDRTDDDWIDEEALQRWSSARSLVLDTICEVRTSTCGFNLRLVLEHLLKYPVHKKRLLFEDLGQRLGCDILHNEDDRIPTNSVEILQARYKGLPDVPWSW